MSLTDAIRKQFDSDLKSVTSTLDLENLKVKFLGRKGPVQQLMQQLKEVSTEERPRLGKEINELKESITAAYEELKARLIAEEESRQLAQEVLDVTLPGRRRFRGRKHPLTQALNHMVSTLVSMGFSVQYGPEIDTDYYNFEALNFPSDHPARDMQDTFYISPQMLLRTHTSTIQIRAMESYKPPIRIIAPGKTYRNEEITARSHVFFHQVEALYINHTVTFSDLLSALHEFFKRLFAREIEIRYRPSYFPFVEPGMEVDLACLVCGGTGCSVCKHSGWLEVAGAGMVHPEVLRNGGIDPEEYTGYAWGMGVERLFMMMHGIKDIRLFTENRLGFLEQFSAL